MNYIFNKFNSKDNKKNKQQPIQQSQQNPPSLELKKNIRDLSVASLIIEWMIKNKACETIGIFRINGETKVMNVIKDNINKNPHPDEYQFDPNSIISVGSVLKDILRDLGDKVEPLFTNKLFKLFMDAFTKINDYYSKVFILKILYYSLPKQNKDFIKDLFIFLKRIAEQSDINQMTEHNLATVFAPNILYNNTYSDNEIFKHYTTSNSVIELLLDEYYYIFENSQELLGNKEVPSYIKQSTFLKQYCNENKDFVNEIKVNFQKYPYVYVISSFQDNEPIQIPVFIKKDGDTTLETHQLEWQLSLPTNIVQQNKQQSFLSSHHKANNKELFTPPSLKSESRPKSFLNSKLVLNEDGPISTSFESSSTNSSNISNSNNNNNNNSLNQIQSSSSSVDQKPELLTTSFSPPQIRKFNNNTIKNPVRHSVNITNHQALKSLNEYNNSININNNYCNLNNIPPPIANSSTLNKPYLSSSHYNVNSTLNNRVINNSINNNNLNNSINITQINNNNNSINNNNSNQNNTQPLNQSLNSIKKPYYPPPPPLTQTRALLNRTTSLFTMSLQNNNSFN